MRVFGGMMIALLLVMAVSVNGSSLGADDIILAMDDHLLFNDNFEMTIRLNSYVNNQFYGSSLMKGYVSNGKMTTLLFLEPANLKGRKVIIKENDLLIIFPNVTNPIRITPAQRIIGGISYSDLAGVSYLADYSPKLLGEELIAGINVEGQRTDPTKCYVLELSAKTSRTNYNRIIFWVDQQSLLPIKADFFALSGKKMTSAYYTAPQMIGGKVIITKMFLFDQVNISKHYSLEYLDLQITPNATGSEEPPK